MPELDTSVFIIPGERVKNGEDRLVVLNRVAKSVVESVRGMHPTHVFCYRDHPVRKINNSAWKRLRGTVGLKHVRVHDLKHTFGRRLRAAGVPLETRKVLLGHRNGDITSHYSAPELAELLSVGCGDEGPLCGPAPGRIDYSPASRVRPSARRSSGVLRARARPSSQSLVAIARPFGAPPVVASRFASRIGRTRGSFLTGEQYK